MEFAPPQCRLSLCLVLVLLQVCVKSLPAEESGKRVCIVGAGVAGLTSARQLLAAGQRVTVLEATAHVGGTWRYEPRVGLDEYGRPIHTSMYQNLRSNVPYQLMELPGFPLPPGTPSFINGTDYYQYLLKYTEYFHLMDYIKLLHEVRSVSREGGAWRVRYSSVATGQQFDEKFDYVLVCVGHYSKPRLPHIPGEKIFQGSIIHSHDYRSEKPYTDRRVLVVGGGPSALDLVTHLTEVSASVVHSHHSKHIRTPFPDNYVAKPDVVQYTTNGALFRDGTYADVDDVIYATGFELNIPFLDASTGLKTSPYAVAPLYLTLVNIYYPSMMVLGLTYHACAIITIAAQAMYAASVVAGRAKQPSQQFMYDEWRRRVDEIITNKLKPSEIHAVMVGEENLRYYNNLTTEANLPPVPPVYVNMCARDNQAKLDNFYTFREYEYTVIDDQNFRRVPNKKALNWRPRGRIDESSRNLTKYPIVVAD